MFYRIGSSLDSTDCHSNHVSTPWQPVLSPLGKEYPARLVAELDSLRAAAKTEDDAFRASGMMIEADDIEAFVELNRPRAGLSCYRSLYSLARYAAGRMDIAGDFLVAFRGTYAGTGIDGEDLAHPTEIVGCYEITEDCDDADELEAMLEALIA